MHMLRQGCSLSLLHRTCVKLHGGFGCRETFRAFGERFKEYLKEPSPVHHCSINTGHLTTQHNFQIIGREGHGTARTIKKSIYIRCIMLREIEIWVSTIYTIYGIGFSLTLLVLKKACTSYWAWSKYQT